ncbi:M56 family peptidase [bacterium]|nr:MAG: M56 family peptidase [bacterium]
MNYRKLKTFSNLFFVFIVFIGLIYTVFLFKLFVETAPGLVMLLVFIVNSVRYGYSILSVQSLNLLLITSLISATTQILIYRYVKTLLLMFKIVGGTRHFTKKLQPASIEDKMVIFSSESISAFTSGLLHPRIHLPANLKKMHSKEEVRAITLHEKQHSLAFDPLKGLVINGIKDILPGFPFKKWVFGHYFVLVELTADAYVEKILNKRLPIISALYKQYRSNSVGVSPAVGFSSRQSERIHVLVGKKRIEIKRPLLVSSIVVTTLFVGTLLIKNKDVFYNCPHLNLCIESAVAPITNNSILNSHL